MTVSLHVEYHAQWGSQLYLTTGTKPKFGQRLPDTAIDMDNDGKGNWFVDVDASQLHGHPYHYVLAYQRHVIRNEFGDGHYIAGLGDAAGVGTLHVWDLWRRLPQIRSFFSLAVRHRHEVIEQRDASPVASELAPNQITMVCEAGKLQDDWQLALIGNAPEVGCWDPEQSLLMSQISRNIWSVSFDRSRLKFPLRFKFVVVEKQTHRFVAWEDCTNRYFQPSMMEPGDSILICDQRFTRITLDKQTSNIEE